MDLSFPFYRKEFRPAKPVLASNAIAGLRKSVKVFNQTRLYSFGSGVTAVVQGKGVLLTMLLAKLNLGAAVVMALVLCDGPAPRTIRVPSEVEGRLLGIFTEIKPGDKVADKDVIVVGEQKYRRLREGDTVKTGQLLARVNDALARDDVDIAEAKIVAAEADMLTSRKTKEEAKQRLDSMNAARARVTADGSMEDLRAAKLTYERYFEEEVAKKANLTVTQRQLSKARTQLKMYEIRSPVDGIVKAVHLQRGEGVKQLETVLEILPLDDDR